MMSTWNVTAADNPFLGWSSFDDLIWIDPGEDGDHIVPEPKCKPQSAWILSDNQCNKLNHRRINNSAKFLGQLQRPFKTTQHSQESKSEFCTWLTSRNKDAPTDGRPSVSSEVRTGFSVTSHPSASSSEITDKENSCLSLSPKLDIDSGLGIGGIDASKPWLNDCEFEEVEGQCQDHPVYSEGDTNVVSSSRHFALYEPSTPEDIYFFEGEHEDGKGINLLDYSWENSSNLENMDTFFQNNDIFFSQILNDDDSGMLWPSPSPGTGTSSSDSRSEHIRIQTSPERRALKRTCTGCEMKMDVSCDYMSPLRYQIGNDKMSQLVDADLEHSLEKLMVHPISGIKGLHKGRTVKTKCNAAGCNRLEEKSRRHVLEKGTASSSIAVEQVGESQMQYMPMRMQQTSSSKLQCPLKQISQQNVVGDLQSLGMPPQPVPYVPAGFGFLTHHMPVVTVNSSAAPQPQQQAQPVFVGYSQPVEDASKQQQQNRIPFEMPMQLPLSNSTMTPQEKIEKLHWRQKMQAKLVVEQQQQQQKPQLITQHLLPEEKQVENNPSEQQAAKSSQDKLVSSNRLLQTEVTGTQVLSESSPSKTEVTAEKDDPLEATIFYHLHSSMSKLDIQTRLCIRDGLYRLARSAVQRRFAGVSNGSTSENIEPQNKMCGPEASSSDDPASSYNRTDLVNIVETETNPIDRSITYLLFHNHYSPPLTGPPLALPTELTIPF